MKLIDGWNTMNDHHDAAEVAGWDKMTPYPHECILMYRRSAAVPQPICFYNRIFRIGSKSLIRNPDFSSGTSRARATIA